MDHRTYTIGDVSRLSGISVRRLRFYSDQGLLPPSGRTQSGYRVYSDKDLVRLDLIRSLRDVGFGLKAIREVLAKRLSLADALQLRLEVLEAEIAAQRRVQAVLRATLRIPTPTDDDLRRLWTVMNLSHAERRRMIERFYDQVSDGVQMDPEWKRSMVEASTPELPEQPTPEQLDAWIELTSIVNDPTFIANMRAGAGEVWNGDFDHAAYTQASGRAAAKARHAIDCGDAPMSEAGRAIARELTESFARAMKREPGEAFGAWLRRKYEEHDPRAARYWELVAVLRGKPAQSSPNREWAWIAEAMKHHLA